MAHFCVKNKKTNQADSDYFLKNMTLHIKYVRVCDPWLLKYRIYNILHSNVQTLYIVLSCVLTLSHTSNT